MTAKFTASSDGSKVLIGNAAEDALEIDATAKTINPLAPYTFGNGQSLTGNGYIKLPGGLTIQWGKTPPITANIDTGAPGYIAGTFPIPFPNTLLSLVGNAENPNQTLQGLSCVVGAPNLAEWSFGLSARVSPATGIAVSWIAVGY